MPEDGARQRLLQFLDEHIFDPVLRVSPDRVDRREAFEDAQTRTERLKRRCHACRDVEELSRLCLELMRSPDGRNADRELDRLGLPTLTRLSARFGAICEQLAGREPISSYV